MLNNINIKNYKSIVDIDLPLGRVNVIIGENGAGKSNVLEAIALAGAASAEKLDNEFLTSRGIRVTEPNFMRSAFTKREMNSPIEITVTCESKVTATFKITNDNKPYSAWSHTIEETKKNGISGSDIQHWLKEEIELSVNSKIDLRAQFEQFSKFFSVVQKYSAIKEEDRSESIILEDIEKAGIAENIKENILINNFDKLAYENYNEIKPALKKFIIYSPENSSLKTFQKEGQIQPLGINGEGLLKLIKVIEGRKKRNEFSKIKENLKLLDWFDSLKTYEDKDKLSMMVKDRFLDDSASSFDQKSANEGFLFLLFYFTLFSTTLTPDFFAVDNIDASLNPKLCQKMMSILCKLSKQKSKQCILTTHNAAILDGLDIFDDQQRLFVIERNEKGHTNCRRITPPEGMKKSQWEEHYFGMKLSEVWLSGAIGGLPKGF